MSRASCPSSITDIDDKRIEQDKANITRLKISSVMNPKHQSFTCGSVVSEIAILYIHGILGSPVEFHRIANALQPRVFHGKAILLPGHGGSGFNFATTKADDWQDHVLQTLIDLRKKYPNIILIGHSLGGLLALEASLHVPVNGIVLLNTPIQTRISVRQISLSLRVLFSSQHRYDPLVSTYRESFSVGIRDFWTLPLWIARFLDVRRIARQTKRILDQVFIPVMIFQSLKDETVNPYSAKILTRDLNEHVLSLTYLEHSTHAYFENEEFTEIIQGINRLIDLTINK